MAVGKTSSYQKKACKRYRDKLINSGLVRFQKYVTPAEKNFLELQLKDYRNFFPTTSSTSVPPQA